MDNTFDLLQLKTNVSAFMCACLGVYSFLFIFSSWSCFVDRQSNNNIFKSVLTAIYYSVCLMVMLITYLVYSASYYMEWQNAFLALIVIPLLIIRLVSNSRINTIYEMRQIIRPHMQSLMRAISSMVKTWYEEYLEDDIRKR